MTQTVSLYLYNGRDCSGFTSDVYRSMGLILLPNSGAQGKSPAFLHQLFSAEDSHEARLKAVMDAQVGDLIVVPGHVLKILGIDSGRSVCRIPRSGRKDSLDEAQRSVCYTSFAPAGG